MRAILAVGVLLVVPATGMADVVPEVLHWSDNHRDAAASLADWVKAHPEGAKRIFRWNRNHPRRSRVFLHWMIEHPQESLDAFVAAHKGWPASDNLLEPHRDAVDSFITWGRAHPEAVRDMTAGEYGLAWVGFHVFPDLWTHEADRPAPPETAK